MLPDRASLFANGSVYFDDGETVPGVNHKSIHITFEVHKLEKKGEFAGLNFTFDVVDDSYVGHENELNLEVIGVFRASDLGLTKLNYGKVHQNTGKTQRL